MKCGGCIPRVVLLKLISIDSPGLRDGVGVGLVARAGDLVIMPILVQLVWDGVQDSDLFLFQYLFLAVLGLCC